MVKSWTAPSTGMFHFLAAEGAPPHRFEDCDDQCHGDSRRGWFGWVAKGAMVDPDDDPNLDPGRFG